MDFREATDRLCARLDHEDVAKALSVSLQTVRQARMQNGSTARRSPPPAWRQAMIRLAEQEVLHYRNLISELRADEGVDSKETVD